MQFDKTTGDIGVARTLALTWGALILELHEYAVGKYTFAGFVAEGTQLVSRDEVDIVISLDNWKSANTELGLEVLYQDVAEYLVRNRNVNRMLWFVGDTTDVYTAESRVRGYAYAASLSQQAG